MHPFVFDTVLKETWQGAAFGYSAVIKPSRVTTASGSASFSKVGGFPIKPPVTTIRNASFHYYLLGQLPLTIVGIFEDLSDTWMSLLDLTNKYGSLMEIIYDNGLVASPNYCFIQRSRGDNSFLIAVLINPTFNYGTTVAYLKREEDSGLITLENDYPIPLNGGKRFAGSASTLGVTARFYLNHKTNSNEIRNLRTEGKDVLRRQVVNSSNTTIVLNTLNAYNSEEDKIVSVTANGQTMTLNQAKLSIANLKSKDVVINVDHTIKYKTIFPFYSTPDFVNDRSVKQHVLFVDTDVHSVDEIDVYLGIGELNTFRGYRLDVEVKGCVSILTPRAIAINDLHVTNLRLKHAILDNVNLIKVYVVVREGIRKTGVYNDPVRLDVFDILPNDVKSSFIEGDVTHRWAGNNLLKAPTNVIKTLRVDEMNQPLIEEAFSYSGLKNLLMKSAVKLDRVVTGSDSVFNLNIGYSEFKHESKLDLLYFNKGKLISSRIKSSLLGRETSFKNPLADTLLVNLTPDTLFEYSGLKKIYDDVFLSDKDLYFGYQCFVSTKLDDGTVTGEWRPAEKDKHYIVKNNKVVWQKGMLNIEGVAGVTVKNTHGCHTLTSYISLCDNRDFIQFDFGLDEDGLPFIPPANIDIYIDRNILIQNIDYVIKNNKLFIIKHVASKLSELRIKTSGISHTGNWITPLNIGYVDNRKICFDRSYIYFNNKETQTAVGGLLYRDDQVVYADQDGAMVDAINGRPYHIKRYYQQLDHLIDKQTSELLINEDMVDEDIKSNLNDLIVTSSYNRTTTSLLAVNKWKLISPFMNELIRRLTRLNWLATVISKEYTKEQTDVWLARYLWLLDYDPCLNPDVNTNFVRILSSVDPVDLNEDQIKFINFINVNYLLNKVVIS